MSEHDIEEFDDEIEDTTDVVDEPEAGNLLARAVDGVQDDMVGEDS